MKNIPTTVLALAALTGASAAAAKPPPHSQASVHALQEGLQALGADIGAGQGERRGGQKTDNDQGDDNASDRAIFEVCNHSNPSAQRSAICTQPNSPN